MEEVFNQEVLQKQFAEALSNHDKNRCVDLILGVLKEDRITIPEIYENILAPSLATIASNDKEQEIAIWEEHIRSGIVRTIVELCFPYVKKIQSEQSVDKPKAIVFCQEEEYHELGARMSTDFLTLLGFDAVFIGANTPKEEVYKAVKALKPVLVSISVTGFYHLSKIEKMIAELKVLVQEGQLNTFAIVIGGYAVDHTPNAKTVIHADFFAHSFEELKRVKEAIL